MHEVKPKPCSGAEGSPVGPVTKPMDKPPNQYFANKEELVSDPSGLTSTEAVPDSLFENAGSKAKRFA